MQVWPIASARATIGGPSFESRTPCRNASFQATTTLSPGLAALTRATAHGGAGAVPVALPCSPSVLVDLVELGAVGVDAGDRGIALPVVDVSLRGCDALEDVGLQVTGQIAAHGENAVRAVGVPNSQHDQARVGISADGVGQGRRQEARRQVEVD